MVESGMIEVGKNNASFFFWGGGGGLEWTQQEPQHKHEASKKAKKQRFSKLSLKRKSS